MIFYSSGGDQRRNGEKSLQLEDYIVGEEAAGRTQLAKEFASSDWS